MRSTRSKCVAPLMIRGESDWPAEAQLSLYASCCVVRMGVGHIAITAAHAVRGVEPRHIGIPTSLNGALRLAPVLHIVTPEDESGADIRSSSSAAASSSTTRRSFHSRSVAITGSLMPMRVPATCS